MFRYRISRVQRAVFTAPLLLALFLACVESTPTGLDPVATNPGDEADAPDSDDGSDVPDPETGSVLVAAVTEGRSLDLDVNGYKVFLTVSRTVDADSAGSDIVIDTVAAGRIGSNQEQWFGGLEPGIHEIELADLEPNCLVEGENPISAEVAGEDTVSIVFRVQCAFVFRPIAFVRRFGTSAGSIVITNLDGSNVRYLSAPDDELSDTSPAWSPSGDRIAFRQFDGGDWNWRVNLWIMNADGSNRTELTDDYADDPSWSPDGRRIAFATGTGYSSDQDIYVMDSDGSGWVQLTSASGYDGEPSWSPDGTRIAFTSERNGSRDIWVMQADGSNPVNLTSHSAADGQPAWSPDGTRIAFSTDRDGQWEVYVMEVDGTNPTRLTARAGEDSEPTWAPDGSQIAFTCEDSGNLEVCVMDADGSNLTNVTRHPADDRSPVWSPSQPTPSTE